MEDITNNKKEEELSSKSDPEPNLNKAEDLYPHRVTKKLRPNQVTKNMKVIIREHRTCLGRITLVKLLVRLHRNGT